MKYPQIVTLIVLTLFVSSVFSFSRYALTSFVTLMNASQEQSTNSGLTINAYTIPSVSEGPGVMKVEPKPCIIVSSVEEDDEENQASAGYDCSGWKDLFFIDKGLFSRKSVLFPPAISITDICRGLAGSL